jgi:short-subunit dehydrogenase
MSDQEEQQRENVLVVGATSGIAGAFCHRLARSGHRLIVAGRNSEELARIGADLRVRYEADVTSETFDASDFESHTELVDRCLDHFNGRLDGVAIFHGYLPDRDESISDFAVIGRTIEVNFTSVVSLLTPIANRMQRKRSGWIAVVSSIAGDRGRQSNYVYGSAKAGLSVYLDGLRNRLFHHGVHVLTIKPGFVDTAMTQGRINTQSPLVASPEKVAADIEKAIRQRRNRIYTPWFWRPIMRVIKSLPEPIFKRLKL